MNRAYSPKEIAAKKWVTLPWDEKWSKPFGFPCLLYTSNRKIKRFISLIKDGIRNFIDRFNWVYIELTWLIRVGECMAAAAAFFVPDYLI